MGFASLVYQLANIFTVCYTCFTVLLALNFSTNQLFTTQLDYNSSRCTSGYAAHVDGTLHAISPKVSAILNLLDCGAYTVDHNPNYVDHDFLNPTKYDMGKDSGTAKEATHLSKSNQGDEVRHDSFTGLDGKPNNPWITNGILIGILCIQQLVMQQYWFKVMVICAILKIRGKPTNHLDTAEDSQVVTRLGAMEFDLESRLCHLIYLCFTCTFVQALMLNFVPLTPKTIPTIGSTAAVGIFPSQPVGMLWSCPDCKQRALLVTLQFVGWVTMAVALFTPHVDRQVHNFSQQRKTRIHNFNPTGIRCFVRHPLEAGFLISLFSVPDMTYGHFLLSCVLAVSSLLAVFAIVEPALLAKDKELQLSYRSFLSQDEVWLGYERYMDTVPALLPCPGIYWRVSKLHSA